MEFQIKDHLKNVLKVSLLLIMFFAVACNSDEEKVEEIPAPGEENPIPVPEIDLLSKLSSFEVPISGGRPVKISELANSLATHPGTAYGMTAAIDFVINDDNTIDILWISRTRSKHLMRVSLISKTVIKHFVLPFSVNSGGFLGFDSLGNDRFVIGYSKNNSFGDKEAEAWYTTFDGNTGKEIFNTRIFGDANLADISSKGEPGLFGSALVKYNAVDNVIAIYTAHTQRRSDNNTHQAGWLGFLNATTGEILTKGPNNDIIGNTWFYSHNFDQRGMFSKSGKFYVLAHGDAYPRSLGFAKFSSTLGNEGSVEYHKVKNGSLGDNTTNAHTGDFEELSNGNVAIVFSTSDDRANRDIKLVILNALESTKPTVNKELWLSNNAGTEYVGWGSKVVQFGDKILVGWNTFDGRNPLNTKFCLTDLEGKLISDPIILPDAVLYPTQSIKKTKDGKNAVFVTYNEGEKLVVNIFANEQ